MHQPPESPVPPARTNGKEFFPWATRKLMDGEIIAVSRMIDLPAEAARDLETWRRFGTKSTVIIPLSVGGGAVFGVVSFAVTREEIHWRDYIVDGFRVLAQMFANALSRKHADQALREKQTRIDLATEAAGAGLWGMGGDFGRIWVTPKTREIFRFAPDEEITYDSFARAIHPDDVEKVHQAVQQTLQCGDALLIDYRINSPDGGVRWISSRGSRIIGPNGEPERIMGVSLDITERKRMEERLRERLSEIESLREQLEMENVYLREEVELRDLHEEIVGRSCAMKHVLTQVEQVARTDSTVLVAGETGTGKELVAKAVHRLSARRDRPLVIVNCGALPPALVESELFGREKGAYTGALTRMAGRFETADGGTLFLDEVGELPPDAQVKLLRFLEEGTFERLGSSRPLRADVRIVAATNRDLGSEVAEGRFRMDLYYRLNVFPISVPPLRERPEDIPPLAWNFVRQYERKMGKRIEHIPRKGMEALQRYPWPGNARELRNVIERAMIASSGRNLEVQAPLASAPEASRDLTLEDAERGHITGVLKKTGWRVTGKGGAAEILGLKRTTLQAKMKKLGIRRPSA